MRVTSILYSERVSAKDWMLLQEINCLNMFAGMREMHHIVRIVSNRKDPEHRRGAHWLITTLIQDAAERGWGEYRIHLAVMDQIAKTYSFNDNAQMKLNEKIKEALDPKGILAPGKNRVWPKHYNSERFKVPV